MKKTIRILAIVCLAMMLVSVLVTGVCLVLQKSLIRLVYGYPDLGNTFAIPIGTVVYALGAVLVLGLLCPVAGNKRIGIWADLILAAVGALVLPGLQTLLTLVQSNLIGKTVGSAAILTNSMVTSMCSYTMMPGNLGMKLALIVCGMSIAFKLLQRQQTPAL